MSVLIKGMKMPSSCHECVAGFGMSCFVCPPEEDGECPDKGRPSWCPLIEVPPHGRLIDADALIDVIEGITWYHQNRNKDMVEGANSAEEQAWYRWQDITSAINAIPTVIESEETSDKD